MSKITTVIKVMEQMRKEENGKMHIKGELTSGDEVMLTVDREVEKGHRSRRAKGQRFQSHGSDWGHGHHQQRRGDGEGFMKQLGTLGFSDEEIEQLKASKDVLKNSRPNPKDRMLMGLKMLDRMDETKDGDTKQLSFTFTKDDMPEHMAEVRQAMKVHGDFVERLHQKAEQEGHEEMTMFAEHMGHRHLRPHMEDMKKTLADKGIDIHDVDVETGQVTVTIDGASKVMKVVWTAELKDSKGQSLYFKGEGVPA